MAAHSRTRNEQGLDKQGLDKMSDTVTKDPEALLRAFAGMLNEFYGNDADDTPERLAAAPLAPQQAGLEFDSTVEALAANASRTGAGPWEAYDVQKKKGVNLQVPPDLYKKMIWLTENVPKMSHLKLARMGLEAEVERLLSLHYRPES